MTPAPSASPAPAPSTKLDPERLVLRARPARAIRFKRGLVIALVALAVSVVSATSWFALRPAALHLAERGIRNLVSDKLFHQRVLGVVRVLVFVDQHVTEAAAVVLRDVREDAQDVDRRHDEVVEVERVGLPQAPLV